MDKDQSQIISWDDFFKVELRVGKIITAELFEGAKKPAYILHIDFGQKIGIKKSSSQLTELYAPDELVGKKIIAVVNFPKKQIAHIQSECLVTGFYDSQNRVILAVPDKHVPLGSKLL